MTSPAAPAQCLPLWAKPLALRQNRNPNPFPDEIASPAKPNVGCAPVQARCHRRRQLAQNLRGPIPKLPASRPAIAPDVVGLVRGSLPVSLCPAEIAANPIASAIPTTAGASAANCAIPAYPPSEPRADCARRLSQNQMSLYASIIARSTGIDPA